MMCYAIIELTPIGLKQPLVTSQSQTGRLDKQSQHASVDTLPQHGITQSQASEAGHTIPAYNNTDKQSQHAVIQTWTREARHTIPACSLDQSQVGKVRHAISLCTVQTSYPSMHCKTCTIEAEKH